MSSSVAHYEALDKDNIEVAIGTATSGEPFEAGGAGPPGESPGTPPGRLGPPSQN